MQMNKRPAPRQKRGNAPTGGDRPGQARAIASLGRQFDDLYEQLDVQLTRMAHIQLQFDTLRSKFRQL